jgi:hypothetical protein
MDGILQIQLSEEGADAERLDTLTGYLRQELLDLDTGQVSPLRVGETPAGTRAFDVVAVGGLVVSLINSDALQAVVATVKNWLSRGQSTGHAVRLEIDGDAIDLSAASTAEQERLIDMFITRHGAGKDNAWAANAKP